jgi:hypothetical protein
MIRVSVTNWPVLAAMLGLPLVLGERPRASEGFTLEVRVVGISGTPVEKSSINLWRLMTEPRRGANDDKTRAREFWREEATGKVWEAIGGVSTSDRWTRSDLAPGTYRVSAGRQVGAPEDLLYSAAEKGMKLVVVPKGDQVIQVAMVGRPLQQAEIENRWGWVATGTVVDEAGRPIEGADVGAATGWGTLMGGGSTKTDGRGRFTLRFGEGILSTDPANVQAAVFNVSMDGYVEKSRSRPGRHLMARRMPEASARHGVDGAKIVLRGIPYPIDFQLARPATIEVDLHGPAGATLAVTSRNDPNEGTYSRQVGPNRWDLVASQAWQFTLYYREQPFPITSFPITLPSAGRYRATLSYKPDRERGVDVLEFATVTRLDGRDIKNQVVGDDPLARPAVPEALQQRGRDLLKKMAETNIAWLGAVPKEAKHYEYRFRLTGQEAQTFKVGDTPSAGAATRGISYFSSVHYLASNPDGVTFRQVEIGDDRITLAYTLKEPITVWAGNGIATKWHGFFSMPWRQGVLVLNSRRLTPLENRSQELTETFAQYIEVGKGLSVPLAIQLDQRGRRFDWTFQVVEPALWLFASSYSDRGEVAARVDQIKVNRKEATVIAQGEHEARKSE